jgi:hypothetical protein
MRWAGIAIAGGGVAWVLKFVLIVCTLADPRLQPVYDGLWLAGFLLPIAIAVALTIYLTRNKSRLARLGVFLISAITAFFIVALTLVSVTAFAQALLLNAPLYLTADLPVLVMGFAGLALAPLLWLEWEEVEELSFRR